MNTIGSRLAYENAKKAVNDAGFSVNQAVLSQSYLRLEVPLSTTQTSYQFPVLVNDIASTGNAAFSTEQRLNLQDVFVASGMLLAFGKPSSATDSSYQLVTYPNASIFSTANTATSLYQWYNGTMSVTINNRQIVPAYDLYRHYDVPQQQTTANADYSTSGINYKDQQKGSMSGVCPIEPSWVFVGSKQNVLQVNLKSAMTAVETYSRAVLIFFGHLAQNCTPVR